MRASLLRRRRRLDLFPPDLAAILALNPTVVVYPSVSLGTLFQDAAATVPAGVGDPVGAVIDPVTGEIVADQASSGARPVVESDGRSISYSSGKRLNLILADYQFITQTAEFTMLACFNGTAADSTRAGIFTGRLAGATGGAGIYYERSTATEAARNFWTENGAAIQESVVANAYDEDRRYVSALTGNGFAGNLTSFTDGAQIAQRSLTGAPGVFDAELSIGADGANARFFLGEIDICVLWDRALTPAEIASLSAALEAL